MRAIAVSPDHARTHGALASIAYEQDRFDEAFAGFQRAAALDPDDPEYPSGAGLCLIRLRRRREALDFLARAVTLGPDDAARRRFYDYHLACETEEARD
jgi:Flp pilus assembly protein TadD